MFSQHGHLNASRTSDRALVTSQERARGQTACLGIDSRVIYPDEIRELCPELRSLRQAHVGP